MQKSFVLIHYRYIVRTYRYGTYKNLYDNIIVKNNLASQRHSYCNHYGIFRQFLNEYVQPVYDRVEEPLLAVMEFAQVPFRILAVSRLY